jgi:cyclopropane-fatty-acyl-phospholipid synthase
MWLKVFDRFVSGMMVRDRLTVQYPDGSTQSYGPQNGEQITVVFHDEDAIRNVCVNPSLGLGEGYMDDRVTFPDGLERTLKILLRNRESGGLPAWLQASNALRFHIRRFVQHNAPKRARQNVAHHYDLSDDLYAKFLDTDMQYSCAYFTDPEMTLEAAQEAKKAHIGAKLGIGPGCHVLDIGCGWGGMALTLARDFGARVTGITLSENQLATAQRRAREAGLEDRVTFRLEDYRHTGGTYDRIVSVGMLEHVGVPNYGTYFERVAELLDPEGIALIHTIGRSGPPAPHDPWIHKYIFPGGYIPSLSELAGPMEDAGLWQADIEVWRLHYAYTIRHWRDRFDKHRAALQAEYDSRFIRMFEYYFTTCIIAFEDQMQAVYHFQLAHKRDAVPLTRDYLYQPATEKMRQTG